jgi:hypothetical protein
MLRRPLVRATGSEPLDEIGEAWFCRGAPVRGHEEREKRSLDLFNAWGSEDSIAG